jgi:hypothetical protein
MDGVAQCELAPPDRPTVPLGLATRREPGSPALRNFDALLRRAVAATDPNAATAGT